MQSLELGWRSREILMCKEDRVNGFMEAYYTCDGYWRRHEACGVEVVEFGGNVARQLDVLQLILADGHVGGAKEQNVGRLQHGVGEQAERSFSGRFRLVLELIHSRQLWQCHLTAEYPSQLAMVGHLRLLIEDGALRIDAAR
jgi:hypothetical protein